MNSLFRNVILRSKDSLLKESLQSQLVACVKDVQLDQAHSGRFQNSSETAEALCTILEAIFIHGIKETLAEKMAIAIGDPDARPEPNFWPALLIFSHRELIDQIAKLNFISSDIGRCRAWLRMALNDNLLTSYLQSMLAQNNALKSFYNRSAYIRDTELLDLFITLISGIETYSFNLACNSSLLNMWTNQPLLMAGIWSPAMKACPITSGTDIARSLMIEDSALRAAEDSVSSVASVASFYGSSLDSSAFDEDEALKIILGADKAETHDQNESNKIEIGYASENITSDMKSESKIETTNIEAAETKEKNITKEITNNVDNENDPKNGDSEYKEPPSITENKVENQNHKVQSYHSLVESYNQTSTSSSKVADLEFLLEKFQMPPNPSTTVNSFTDNDSDMLDKLDFEIVPDSLDPFQIPEFNVLMEHVNKIATEEGLDVQNYTCKTCTQPIGINFGPARVCGLTGAYHCTDCYGTNPAVEYWVIPGRVIYNWDFRRYSVSRRAAEFLAQTQLYPLFDMSVVNPKIYSAVEEMARLKEFRVRLNFLCAYLHTCRENTIKLLQRQLWPREYLYEKIHHYSLSDLIQVSTGVLESVLQKAVDLACNHVVSCTLCTQKGFICEICNNPSVIYPFDLETTYRCKNCSAVYHAKCLQAGQLCPKCIRIQQRELAIQPL